MTIVYSVTLFCPVNAVILRVIDGIILCDNGIPLYLWYLEPCTMKKLLHLPDTFYLFILQYSWPVAISFIFYTDID